MANNNNTNTNTNVCSHSCSSYMSSLTNPCHHLSEPSSCLPSKTISNYDETQIPFKKRKSVRQETSASTKKTFNNVVGTNWEIKKVLEHSDIRVRQNRLLLSNKLAQQFVIPVLGVGAVEKGIEVKVWDADTNSLHSLFFTKWSSSRAHIFTHTWFNDFVVRRNLNRGDEIGLYWDQYNKRFIFSVLHANLEVIDFAA